MDMIKFIFVLALSLLFWHRRSKKEGSLNKVGLDIPEVSVEPASPIPFGYKVMWLAIPTEDTLFVIEALGLSHQRKANWESGLNAVHSDYSHSIFVPPPVKGWTFVIGSAFGSFSPDTEANESFIKFINELGRKIPTFYSFGNHRVSDYYSWIAVREGAIERAYASYEGEILYEVGDETIEEKQLKLKFFNSSSKEAGKEGYYERKDLRFADEDDVIGIASLWSINPLTIDQSLQEKALGVLGRV